MGEAYNWVVSICLKKKKLKKVVTQLQSPKGSFHRHSYTRDGCIKFKNAKTFLSFYPARKNIDIIVTTGNEKLSSQESFLIVNMTLWRSVSQWLLRGGSGPSLFVLLPEDTQSQWKFFVKPTMGEQKQKEKQSNLCRKSNRKLTKKTACGWLWYSSSLRLISRADRHQ